MPLSDTKRGVAVTQRGHPSGNGGVRCQLPGAVYDALESLSTSLESALGNPSRPDRTRLGRDYRLQLNCGVETPVSNLRFLPRNSVKEAFRRVCLKEVP